MKQYMQNIFLILFATQFLKCFCAPISSRNQNLIKRSLMRGEQEQLGTQSGTSTSSTLRPGRQRYRKFDSVTITPSHQTVQQSQNQRHGNQHYRPTPIRTGRNDHSHTIPSHSTYHSNTGYSGNSNSPPRQSNNLAGRLTGAAVGAVGESMVMNAMGMHPDIVTTYHHGRPHTGFGYSAGINNGGNNSNQPSSPGCVGCLDALFSGNSGSSSSW